jgi:hypothetical protein
VISYTAGDTPPPAANLEPLGSLSGGAPYTLSFGFDSVAPPGATLTQEFYRWGDGSNPLVVFGPPFFTETHTYAHPGTYLTTLRVLDNQNASDTDSEIITVTKSPSALSAAPGVVHTLSNTVSMSATLKRTDTNTALAGKTVFFGTNNALVCIATTNASGVAACTGPLSGLATTAVSNGYVATFTGDQDTVGSSANGKLTAQANAADVRGPRARIGRLRTRVLHGSAAAGTRYVLVAIVRSGPGGCAHLGANGKLARTRATRGWCVPAVLLRATGTRHWSYKLRRRLRPARYQLYAIAIGPSGQGRATERTINLK